MSMKGIVRALAVFALFTTPTVSAQTLTASGDLDALVTETAIASCISSSREDSIGEVASASSRCLIGSVINKMIDTATVFANEGAQARFNENFQIINHLKYSPTDGQLRGDLDVIVPLSFSGFGGTSMLSTQKPNALFLQQGVTTWKDGHSFRRNDLRFGVVRRFAVSQKPESGIFGVSAFIQQNLERGHKRLVTGFDYAGKLGVGTFNYFKPITSWRQGRPKHEERPMEGMELGFSMDLTTTINLTTAVGRWENRNFSNPDQWKTDRWRTGGRIGLKFKPHTWLDFGVSYNTFGRGSNDTIAYSMTFYRPLGGGVQKQPTWDGFGKFAGGSAPSASALWKPNRNVDRIEYVERSAIWGIVEGATVRFLQDTVVSGEEVRMEVSLSAPVSEDTRLMVRLMPGGGANPVVAGEDYVNEPVEVTVPSGASSAEFSIRLLLNPDMTGMRTLSARVYPVSS